MALQELTIDSTALLSQMTSPQVRFADLNQRTVGRNMDLAVIEAALRNATYGLMADLTDLEGETKDMDPNMSTALGKRFGRVIAAPIRWEPQCPAGGDEELAKKYASAVETVIGRIPFLRARLRSLMWALYHGRGALECTWSRGYHATVPGLPPMHTVPTQLSWVPPRNLSIGPQRELRVINPDSYSGNFTNRDGIGVTEYPGKFVWWTPQLFCEQAEREGLGPRCLYWSFFKRMSWRLRLKLTELFGIPWRIVSADKDAKVGDAQLKSAREAAEALGADTTAQLAPGMKLDVILPNGDVGDLFAMTSRDVDDQISRLVLWTSGTMAPQPTGLGSDMGKMLQSEQELVVVSDFYELCEVLMETLVRPLMAVNFGDEAASLYCPRPAIDGKPRDRMAELGTKRAVVEMGIPVSIREIREAAGVEEPKPGEETIGAPVNPVGDFGFGLPIPDAPASDKPAEPSKPLAMIELAPTDLASVVTVNEARAQSGLGALLRQDGTPDPDGDLTIAEFRTKREAKGEVIGTATGEAIAPPDPTPPIAAPAPPTTAARAEEAPAAPIAGPPASATPEES